MSAFETSFDGSFFLDLLRSLDLTDLDDLPFSLFLSFDGVDLPLFELFLSLSLLLDDFSPLSLLLLLFSSRSFDFDLVLFASLSLDF